MEPEDPEAWTQRGSGFGAMVRRIRFRTETGSLYEVIRDERSMAWSRVPTLSSGKLRTATGRLLTWPEVTVGRHCLLICEPLLPPLARLVVTSLVVAVLECDSGYPADSL
jgi:hypothetical protein